MPNILYEKIMSDPWLVAYECSKKKCDIAEIIVILRQLLSSHQESREYIIGLELLKALKSMVPPAMYIRLARKVFDEELLDKIVSDLDPEIVINEYAKNYAVGMSYLTLLETLPFLGKRKEAFDKMISILKTATIKLKDDPELLREFVRALVFGPFSFLSPNLLVKLFRTIQELPDEPLYLQLKSDLLLMIIENYPPKMFQDYPEISVMIGKLLRGIAERNLLIFSEDPDMALSVYYQLSVFLSKMSNMCRELNDWKPCGTVMKEAGETLSEMNSRIGRFIIALNAGREQV